jgi:hypothetical protein
MAPAAEDAGSPSTLYRYRPQSNELSRGSPELVLSTVGDHIGARALPDPKFIWFGYITRLSQWEEGGVIYLFK